MSTKCSSVLYIYFNEFRYNKYHQNPAEYHDCYYCLSEQENRKSAWPQSKEVFGNLMKTRLITDLQTCGKTDSYHPLQNMKNVSFISKRCEKITRVIPKSTSDWLVKINALS